jgi:hypothetical protein
MNAEEWRRYIARLSGRDNRTIDEIDDDRAAAKQERILQRIGRNLIRAVKRCQ